MKGKIIGIVICSLLIVGIIALLVCNWTGAFAKEALAQTEAENPVAIPMNTAFLGAKLHTLETSILFLSNRDFPNADYSIAVPLFYGVAPRITMYPSTPTAGTFYIGDQRLNIMLSGQRWFTTSWDTGYSIYQENGQGNWRVNGPNSYSISIRSIPSPTCIASIHKWSGMGDGTDPVNWNIGGGWCISSIFYSFDNQYLTIRVICDSLRYDETDYFDIEMYADFMYIELWGEEVHFDVVDRWQTGKGSDGLLTSSINNVYDNIHVETVEIIRQMLSNNDQFQIGYENGYQSGWKFGYESGKADGISGGIDSATPIQSVKAIIKSVAEALNFKLFGVISILDLIGIMVVLGLVGFILRFIR